MSKITPKLIIDNHTKNPKNTKILIENYAFNEYKKAISDLMRFAKRVDLPDNGISMLVLSRDDLNRWLTCTDSHWHINKHFTK